MDNLTVSEEKKQLRAKMKNLLAQLPKEIRDEISLKVFKRLQKLDAWNNADTVLAFLSMKEEIETGSIINAALKEGKRVAVPRIENNCMEFYYIDSLSDKNLVLHSYGMLEPGSLAPMVKDEDFKQNKILIVTPGLAFDSRCMRLGRGKSYYDRFISKHKNECIKAGIAFQFQITDKIPSEEHDMQLDFVITESRIYTA
ncbi:MAG: 5-formyltetrahydrofolate cyclo-ligase [Spirochaetia bacterium]|jgi:5-formyltetrahydrofolate cyclo-ligase|nr:5-formyltetrahydrofolate cyclo-ligase [Spirochaetia bacterium]